MKNIPSYNRKFILILLIMGISIAYSQSVNVLGKKSTGSDFKDSLFIYYNAIRVNAFFDSNRAYIKTRTREIKTQKDKKEVFVLLQQARNLFYILRSNEDVNNKQDKSAYVKPNPLYKDINYAQYFRQVDDNIFYQRELENQIINSDAPMPAYDKRINPFLINEYKCVDSSSIYYGDIVNIPLYIPVIVKPFSLLTLSEHELRNHLLQNEKHNETMSTKIKVVDVLKTEIIPTGSPVFLYNQYGSGSIIGFIKNRVFRKLRPEEYKKFVVQKYAQNLLENIENLNKWIKLHYGAYCIASI